MKSYIKSTRISSVPALIAICLALYVFALVIEKITGIQTVVRITALSDTALLYLVSAALCLSVAISLVLPSCTADWLRDAVVGLGLDTLWLVCSALLVGAIYAGLFENRWDVVKDAAPIILSATLVSLAAGFIWSDFQKAKPTKKVRWPIAIFFVVVGVGFVLALPIPK